jgi:hypothetical protein
MRRHLIRDKKLPQKVVDAFGALLSVVSTPGKPDVAFRSLKTLLASFSASLNDKSFMSSGNAGLAQLEEGFQALTSLFACLDTFKIADKVIFDSVLFVLCFFPLVV